MLDVCHGFCTTCLIAPARYRGFRSQAKGCGSSCQSKGSQRSHFCFLEESLQVPVVRFVFFKGRLPCWDKNGKTSLFRLTHSLWSSWPLWKFLFIFFYPPLAAWRWQAFPERRLRGWIYGTSTLNLASREVPGLAERLFSTVVSATQGISLVPGGLVRDYQKLGCSPHLFLAAFLRSQWSSWDSFCFSKSKRQESFPESQVMQA